MNVSDNRRPDIENLQGHKESSELLERHRETLSNLRPLNI